MLLPLPLLGMCIKSEQVGMLEGMLLVLLQRDKLSKQLTPLLLMVFYVLLHEQNNILSLLDLELVA